MPAFLSLTSALTPRLTADGAYFVVPRDLYPPIEQGAVIVSSTRQRAAVLKFLDFLLSPAVQAQLAKSGLTPRNEAPLCPIYFASFAKWVGIRSDLALHSFTPSLVHSPSLRNRWEFLRPNE